MSDKKSLRKLLSMPFMGFAPWVLLSVVGGPGRVALAAGLACGLAVLLAAAGAIAGRRRPDPARRGHHPGICTGPLSALACSIE
jgi:hypothetical protein